MCFILNIPINNAAHLAAQAARAYQLYLQQQQQEAKDARVQKNAQKTDDTTVDNRKAATKEGVNKQVTGQTQAPTTPPTAILSKVELAVLKMYRKFEAVKREVDKATSAVDEENLRFVLEAIKEGKSGLNGQEQAKIAAAVQEVSPQGARRGREIRDGKKLVASVDKNPKFANFDPSIRNVAKKVLTKLYEIDGSNTKTNIV